MFSTNRDDYEIGIFTAKELRWLIKSAQKLNGNSTKVLENPYWRSTMDISPPAMFVPESTFKRWRRGIGITPDDRNRYTREDLNVLVGLAEWLAMGRTIEDYDKYLTEVFSGYQTTATG